MLAGIHNIHFIGIGGAGMSALAHVLCERGFHVSGSDKNAGGICEKLKALACFRAGKWCGCGCYFVCYPSG